MSAKLPIIATLLRRSLIVPILACCWVIFGFQSSAIGGCHSYYNVDRVSIQNVDDKQALAEFWRLDAIPATCKAVVSDSWIYDAGQLIRLAYPVPQPCSGPHCKGSEGPPNSFSIPGSKSTTELASTLLTPRQSKIFPASSPLLIIYKETAKPGNPAQVDQPPETSL